MKVYLDPGHGGDDSGAVYGDLLEKDINLDICRATQHILQYRDWVAMSRNIDIAVPLRNRADFANSWSADIFISVHCNADPDEDLPGMPQAQGEEIWIYPGSTKGLALARALKVHVDEFFPLQGFRGIKESAKLAVLRLTQMPAVLIEVGFIDHFNTAGAFSQQNVKNRIGHLIAQGVKKYQRYITKGA